MLSVPVELALQEHVVSLLPQTVDPTRFDGKSQPVIPCLVRA